mmetsp:Transcript_15835/g.33099  ORF Transcript_15835/g.33099 Transcript_15835/m.33099 type:complete len:299 (+) Transcript_15835:902-1798(+)
MPQSLGIPMPHLPNVNESLLPNPPPLPLPSPPLHSAGDWLLRPSLPPLRAPRPPPILQLPSLAALSSQPLWTTSHLRPSPPPLILKPPLLLLPLLSATAIVSPPLPPSVQSTKRFAWQPLCLARASPPSARRPPPLRVPPWLRVPPFPPSVRWSSGASPLEPPSAPQPRPYFFRPLPAWPPLPPSVRWSSGASPLEPPSALQPRLSSFRPLPAWLPGYYHAQHVGEGSRCWRTWRGCSSRYDRTPGQARCPSLAAAADHRAHPPRPPSRGLPSRRTADRLRGPCQLCHVVLAGCMESR